MRDAVIPQLDALKRGPREAGERRATEAPLPVRSDRSALNSAREFVQPGVDNASEKTKPQGLYSLVSDATEIT